MPTDRRDKPEPADDKPAEHYVAAWCRCRRCGRVRAEWINPGDPPPRVSSGGYWMECDECARARARGYMRERWTGLFPPLA